MTRLALLVVRALLWPPFVLGILLLIPFAWAMDRVEDRLWSLRDATS